MLNPAPVPFGSLLAAHLYYTSHLHPLYLEQTIAGIRRHVQLAGYQAGALFADDVLARIYENSKNMPRLINRLCTTTALLVTVADGR